MMFNFQTLPGEAQSTVDWTKLQEDLSQGRSEPQISMVGVALYPVFEVAVWELAALQQLLVALDERYTALEKSVLSKGTASVEARMKLERAEVELRVARTEFLEAFHRLNSQYGKEMAPRAIGIEDEGERRVLEAINALWDMEEVWSSHRVLHPEQKYKAPEAKA